MLLSRELLQTVEQIAIRAAYEILEVYGRTGTLEVVSKEDESPVTEADLRAHELIVAQLRQLSPEVPVLSEESAAISYDQRRQWSDYWLVDPLDGTREFISGNGEFTVNIALIRQGQPVLGVVHVPVTGVSYLGITEGSEAGAWHVDPVSQMRAIQVQGLPPRSAWPQHTLRVVASRRHGQEQLNAELDRWQAHFGGMELLNMGSSLKICLLAEGKADIYPRLAPTSEWDTAAAHAVLKAAGGDILRADVRVGTNTGEPLRYNQKAELLNPSFLALADPALAQLISAP